METIIGENINIWEYAKYIYSLFFVIHVIFALIVVRQINLMIGTINGRLSPVIKLLGWIHLFFAILILLSSFILL